MSKSEIGTVVGDATIVNYFEQNSSYLLNFSVGGTQKAYLASRYIIDFSFFKEGSDGVYRYSGPGVIDAEKRLSWTDPEGSNPRHGYYPKDELVCWAGAISNILEFSGWGDVAGYSNEDDLFDYLKNCFAANNHQSEGATVADGMTYHAAVRAAGARHWRLAPDAPQWPLLFEVKGSEVEKLKSTPSPLEPFNFSTVQPFNSPSESPDDEPSSAESPAAFSVTAGPSGDSSSCQGLAGASPCAPSDPSTT